MLQFVYDNRGYLVEGRGSEFLPTYLHKKDRKYKQEG